MKNSYIVFIVFYVFSFHCLSLDARDNHIHVNVSAPGFQHQQTQNPSGFQSAFTNSPSHELNNRPQQRPLINNAQAPKNNPKKHKQSKKEKRAELTQKSLAAAIIAKQQAWAVAQGVELLQHPDFINFNMLYKKICGVDFFHILPKTHPALAGVFTGIENGLFSSGEQAVITSLFTQAEESVVGTVIKSSTSSMGSQAVQVIEQVIESLVAEEMRSVVQLVDAGCMTKFFEILQNEIAQALQQLITITDLTAIITDAKYGKLRDLIPQIRQLQDLAKYTDNFKNLENLIAQDICYLNRLYELQPYRDKIKNFLDTHKPYFMYEEQAYFIEDIASYHIHAGDYYRKDNPGGAHSNYGGNKLYYFNPTISKHGPLGVKEMRFYNSRLPIKRHTA